MSGPKVVRVITREEIRELCRMLVQQFETELAFLRSEARRLGADADLEGDWSERSKDIRRLQESDDLKGLQTRVTEQLEFIKDQVGTVRERAVRLVERRKDRARRLSEAARALIQVYKASGHPVPESLTQVVAAGYYSSNENLDVVESTINEAAAALATKSRELSNEHRGMLDRLKAGIDHTPAYWTREQGADERDRRIDRLLAEIETFGTTEEVGEFQDRARVISMEQSANRRALLTDALILDLGNRRQRQKLWDTTERKLREASGKLLLLKTKEAISVSNSIEVAIGSRDITLAERLVNQASEIVKAELAARAAQSRRDLVLSALSKLGYEVREGMSATLVENGRLVVRKPQLADYAVELAMPRVGDRVQIRVVGASNPIEPRSAARDKDMETIWCSEFTRLEKLLTDGGAQVGLEKQLKAGERQMDSIAFDHFPGAVDRATRKPSALKQTPL